VGGTLFSLKRKGLKTGKTTGTRNSLKAGTRVRGSPIKPETQGTYTSVDSSYEKRGVTGNKLNHKSNFMSFVIRPTAFYYSPVFVYCSKKY
jgi:hypothetical protein